MRSAVGSAVVDDDVGSSVLLLTGLGVGSAVPRNDDEGRSVLGGNVPATGSSVGESVYTTRVGNPVGGGATGATGGDVGSVTG